MKPIVVRPRKFRAEFEELPAGKARLRYEEELESEELAEHTFKHFGKMAEGKRAGRDGKTLWVELEGDRGLVTRALAGEFVLRLLGSERDALDLIHDLSSFALAGTFPVSEADAREMAKEPLDTGKLPEELLDTSVGEFIREGERAGVQSEFAGDVALRSLRLMIGEGVVEEEDKMRDALPKIHEYRKSKFGGGP